MRQLGYLAIFMSLLLLQACNLGETPLKKPSIKDIQITKTLNLGTPSIHKASFNSTGDILASSSAYNFVFDKDSSDVNQILPSGTYSLDGQYLIVNLNSDEKQLLKVTTGEVLQTFTAYNAIFNADSSLISLWSNENGNEVRVIDSWQLVQEPQNKFNTSPDNKLAFSIKSFTSSREPNIFYEVSLLDIDSNKVLDTESWSGRADGPGSIGTEVVKFSPDSKFVAIAGGAARLWRISDTKELELITTVGEGFAAQIEFSSDSNYLMVDDQLHHTNNGEAVFNFQPNFIPYSAISPDSRIFATLGSRENAESNEVSLWSTNGNLLKIIETDHTRVISSVNFSPDSQQLLSSSADGTVKLWEVSTGELLKTYKTHSSKVDKMLLSPDEKLLVTASNQLPTLGSIIQLWDLELNKIVGIYKDLDSRIIDLAFSSDNKLLATADFKSIKLWEVSTGKLLHTYAPPYIFSAKLSFNKDGSILGIHTSHFGNDKPNYNAEDLAILTFMQVSNGEILDKFNQQHVIFDAYNRFYATRNFDSINTLKVFNINTREEINTFEVPPSKLSFLKNSNSVFSVIGQKIDTWDIISGEIVDSQMLNSTYDFSFSVFSSTISPDGSKIISNYLDNENQVKLWSIKNGQLLHELKGHSSESPIIFTADGTKLIIGSGHVDHKNTVTIYSTLNNDPVFIEQTSD